MLHQILLSLRMHRVPNLLSGARLILAPIFLYFYVQDDLLMVGLSLFIFLVAALTDYFDGVIARKYGSESKFGIFLDPLADKFLTFCGFFALPFISSEQFPWWAIIVIVIRDISITLLRLYADRKHITLKTLFVAKVKTMVQMIFLYVALLLGFALQFNNVIGEGANILLESQVMYYLMIFVTALTAFSGIQYVVVNKQLFKSSTQS